MTRLSPDVEPSSFSDAKRLLEPGEKEVRNPAIAMANWDAG